MSSELANTHSLWIDTSSAKTYPRLEGDIEVDVAIIGGGITGITAADLLKRSGKRVAVIDFSRVGCGETGHTTAHLTEVLDTSYQDLISNFGIDGGRLACQSSRKAIQRMEVNVQRLKIDCDFRRVPAWVFSETSDEIDWLHSEAEAALSLSVPNTLCDSAPSPFPVKKALRFDHQAQFHPLKYLRAIAETIPGDGSHIFEHTRAIDFQDGEPCKVTTERGTITCKSIFIAANVPISNRLFLHTKIAAYRTYAIAFKAPEAKMIAGNLMWDTLDPYHYIRTAHINGEEYIIVGGEDHKTGHDVHTDTHFQNLIDWCGTRFDFIQVPYRWSGQIINPVDGLPYIGRNSMCDNIYVATGYSGNGMTFGTLAGMLVSDLILGQQNPWTELYAATRVKPMASAKQFLSENIDFPTHLISDRLSASQEPDLEHIRENEGALVRVGAKKIAAYRDTEGQMHMMSPVCPHMGCYVNWNNSEKSWDCPCHGSRFSPVGKLLNGPAVTDLASEEADDTLLYAEQRYEEHPPNANPLGSPLMTFMCPFKTNPV